MKWHIMMLRAIFGRPYILVAVKGYSYCYSAIKAVTLIIMNALRMAAVNTVGTARQRTLDTSFAAV